MEKRILTCIGCPMGCELTVELDGEAAYYASGPELLAAAERI